MWTTNKYVAVLTEISSRVLNYIAIPSPSDKFQVLLNPNESNEEVPLVLNFTGRLHSA